MKVPEGNVEGLKVKEVTSSHRVEWKINVSHVLLVVAIAYAAYRLDLGGSDLRGEEGGTEQGTTIEIEGGLVR